MIKTQWERAKKMNRRHFLKSTLLSTIAFPFCASLAKELTPVDKRPNILLCIADDVSFPHMSAYGCKWTKTPAFDRVAAEGILFANAYTPNAKCAPSRACLLTGRNPWQLEEAANHISFFPRKFKTFPEALKEHGYHVGFTGKPWAPGEPGTDKDGVPRLLCGKSYNQKELVPPTPRIYSCDYAANFADFMNDNTENKPFCFWYGCWEPHRRYEYGSGIEKGNKKLTDIDRVFDFWPDNETVRTDMLDYAFELEHFDAQLDKILKLLEQKGQLDNTIIIVTADNGMPFPRVKGMEYDYSNHVPLAIMWKDHIVNPGRTVQDFVSFIDFAPTFLEIANISQPTSAMQPIQGSSVTDIFRQTTPIPSRNHVLIGKERHDPGRPDDVGYPIRGIINNGFLYLHNFKTDRWPACNPETGYLNCDGSPTKTVCLENRYDKENQKYWSWSFGKRPQEELYRLTDDPDCINNLAENDKYLETKNSLQSQLFEELKAQGDPRMFGQGDIFDSYKFSDPNCRNLHQRFTAGEKIKAPWANKSDFQK